MAGNFEKAAGLGLGAPARHFFLCATPGTQKCCSLEDGRKSWDHLKQKSAALLQEQGILMHRTKADCLRVCESGPVGVVYPDGIWYHSCTPDNIDRIVQEHIVEGRPVESLRILPR